MSTTRESSPNERGCDVKSRYPKIVYLSQQYVEGSGPDGGGPWLVFEEPLDAISNCHTQGSTYAMYERVSLGDMKVSFEPSKPVRKMATTKPRKAKAKR